MGIFYFLPFRTAGFLGPSQELFSEVPSRTLLGGSPVKIGRAFAPVFSVGFLSLISRRAMPTYVSDLWQSSSRGDSYVWHVSCSVGFSRHLNAPVGPKVLGGSLREGFSYSCCVTQFRSCICRCRCRPIDHSCSKGVPVCPAQYSVLHVRNRVMRPST